MRPPLRTAISLAGAAALGLVALDRAPEAGLQASNSASQPLQDADNDGLHDYLEVRLGSDPLMADSDGDGMTDLEEYMSGLDAQVPNPASSALLDSPATRINLYQDGGTVYIQVFAAAALSVEHVQIGAADENVERWTDGPSLISSAIQRQSTPTQVAGMSVHSVTVAVSATELSSILPCSIGVIGCLDGTFVGDELQLVEVNNEIHEVRDLSTGGNNRNGLFPAVPDPGSSIPPGGDRLSSEVCVQAMSASGTLGPGSVLYTVDEAYCDFMPKAVCLTDCRLTRGDTVVGLDIPGLVGTLGN